MNKTPIKKAESTANLPSKKKTPKIKATNKSAKSRKTTMRLYPAIKQLKPKVLQGSFYGRYVKRVIDFMIALPLVILTAPIALIIAIAIKLEDGGPVFFVQDRSGLYGKPFKLFKFRSMAVNNDVHDFAHEDQKTKVGAFIRKTSLDEIPQLFNILRGEMSFIGPRPWIEDYRHYFTKDQCRRLEVRPGLSGLAQIKSRNNLTIQHKLWWDIYYVDHLCFANDLRVFFGTIKTIFSGEGAESSRGGIKEELEELKEANSCSVNTTSI